MCEEDKLGSFLANLFIFSVVMTIFLLIKLWEYFSARRIGPKTRTPTIVFPRHNFTVEESDEGVRFLCGFTKYNKKKKLNRLKLTEKLEYLLESVGCSAVYRDARVIMIKMNGFVYGRECHDFEPVGGAAPGSYYTYQMYGNDRIQVTNYVKDGVSYLAGFCVYIQDHNSSPSTYRDDIVDRITWSAKLKNGARLEQRMEQEFLEISPTVTENGAHSVQATEQVIPENSPTASWNGTSARLEEVSEHFPTTNWNVKYCESLRRDVMTTTSNGTVFHKEWDNTLCAMTIQKCVGCVDSDQPPAYTSLFME